MYCSHCGKYIDENKLENEKSSFSLAEDQSNEETKINYVCPQCGHLIHSDLTQDEIKSLSRASHAQLQRAANSLANGMSFTVLGSILLIVGAIFFILANKPSNGFKLVTDCAEFYVSIILTTISLILLVIGIIRLIIGINKKKMYTELLKDLNNETFVQ